MLIEIEGQPTLEFPDDTPEEVIQSVVKRITSGLPVAPSPSRLDAYLGSFPGRALAGVASLVTGPLQAGANIGSSLYKGFGGTGPDVGHWMTEKQNELEAAQRRGGLEGRDWAGLLGAGLAGGRGLMNPSAWGITLPAATKAAPYLQKVARGLGIGGIIGLSAPTTGEPEKYWRSEERRVGKECRL